MNIIKIKVKKFQLNKSNWDRLYLNNNHNKVKNNNIKKFLIAVVVAVIALKVKIIRLISIKKTEINNKKIKLEEL